MANIKEVIFSGREFVNKEGQDDTGYIQAEIKWEYNYGYKDPSWVIEGESEDTTGLPGSIDYTLKFADCSKIIDFNISGGSSANQANSLYKIDKMIEVLTGFRKGLEEAFIAEEHINNVNNKKRKERLEGDKKENE